MVDPRASSAFRSSAEAYDRARPSYPGAAVAALVEELGLGSKSLVLDLAAGTGKLTRRLEPLVGRVIAVEPSEEMRALLRRSLPEVEALPGTAEEMPLQDASIDAVFVGEAFHWFQAAAAGTEIARVLRRDGGLGLLWNRSSWNEESNPWLPDFRELLDPHRTAAGPWPAGRGDWEPVLAGLGLFGVPVHRQHGHEQRLSVDDFVALVSSWSWVANLPESERSRVLDRVNELVCESEVVLSYVAETYAIRRR